MAGAVTPPLRQTSHKAVAQRQLAKERYDAELAERQRREADPFEQACTLLRRRGFAVFAAAVLDGGKPDRWRVGSRVLTRDEVLAMAARQRDPAVKNAPAPVVFSGAAPLALASAAKVDPAKEDDMADRFRGLTEAEIRADLDALAEWHGGAGRAAAACGLAKSTFSNARSGHAAIGETVMLAIYGATGTKPRPELMKQDSADAGVAGSEATAPAVVDGCVAVRICGRRGR